ncbi:hypothetical protein HYH03_008668 [Edaphochlamys debaryana]|uniref:FAD-binding PCMH-type domain-containing protein n=1 Tax=Edaphochlamys debaryana TaxID=47281 RepID=A0A835Y0C9_9CHLO|nr:hypothetical protein HYH03_008668 [Edaphochlamys debaryana]|eukprot:KAG2493004.1 hypothetical protein HYH03_008668 [Edaphochlamys debaryana]
MHRARRQSSVGNTHLAEAIAASFSQEETSDCVVIFCREAEPTAAKRQRGDAAADATDGRPQLEGEVVFGAPLPAHSLILRFASTRFAAQLARWAPADQPAPTGPDPHAASGPGGPSSSGSKRSCPDPSSTPGGRPLELSSIRQALETVRVADYLEIRGCGAACVRHVTLQLHRGVADAGRGPGVARGSASRGAATAASGSAAAPGPEAEAEAEPAVLQLYSCSQLWPDPASEPGFAAALSNAKPALVRHFGDALAALNRQPLQRQLLRLPAAGLEALLESDLFATDSEDSVLTLLATWTAANWARTDAAARRRLAGLGSFQGLRFPVGLRARLSVGRWRHGRREDACVSTFDRVDSLSLNTGLGVTGAIRLMPATGGRVGAGGGGGTGAAGEGEGAAGEGEGAAWSAYLHGGRISGSLTVLPEEGDAEEGAGVGESGEESEEEEDEEGEGRRGADEWEDIDVDGVIAELRGGQGSEDEEDDGDEEESDGSSAQLVEGRTEWLVVASGVQGHSRVKGVGGGWSWNQPFFCQTNGTLAPSNDGYTPAMTAGAPPPAPGGPANVVMETLRPLVIAVNESERSVTVDAGVRTIDLLRFLAAYVTPSAPSGWTLPAFPWFVFQTLGEAVSTGTHGSSLRHKSLSSQVLELTVVLANGTVRTFSSETDPFLMRAPRISVGRLGIVTHIRR